MAGCSCSWRGGFRARRASSPTALAEPLRRGADPERIMAVTTNKAAGELRGRTEKLVEQTFGAFWFRDAAGCRPVMAAAGPAVPRVPRWIGTFHSIGARLWALLARAPGCPRTS